MYNFRDFAGLIGILLVLAIIYILLKWLLGKKKREQGEEEDRENETLL
jgi:hypothetical protein